MAQGFQADSCSTTAQTSAGSSDCAKAALRASAMSWAGNDIERMTCQGYTRGYTLGPYGAKCEPRHPLRRNSVAKSRAVLLQWRRSARTPNGRTTHGRL